MLTILNDVHIGSIRGTGTTPATQLSLRKYIINEFIRLLPDTDLMVLGDLFDKENIPIVDVLHTYIALKDWLKKGHKLYLVAGNHDLSKTSSTMSSFDFLCKILVEAEPNLVTPIHSSQMTDYGYVIPHVANQDLFDLELMKVPRCKTLFLHCNYNNHFAVQLDQSLNLSEEQANATPVDRIIIAHEHHRRIVGKILLPGNQIASSCADWASAGDKYYYSLSVDGELFEHKATIKSTEYCEMPWNGIKDVSQKFVKIVGSADAGKVPAVITAISRFRQASQALVITNGVDVAHDDKVDEFELSLESIESFSIWEALKKVLTEDEVKLLESLNA